MAPSPASTRTEWQTLGMRDLQRVTVPLAERSYDVLVGHGAAEFLGTMIPDSAKRAAIVTQSGVPIEVEANIPHERFEIGRGEQHKSLETIGELCRGFARMGLTRNDVVIGVGGGMVTDVAGFAAASYHRGVPVVHVATTLLGMVDAAIGGKTGVNLPEGKNLVGAFWQPNGVVCDLDALDTLPSREIRCGYGEMAKYHFLTGDDLLSMTLTERVARCVEIKAEIVVVGRARGRAPSTPELRPHARPCARGRHRPPTGPRRGGRDRADLRGPPRGDPRADPARADRRALRRRRAGVRVGHRHPARARPERPGGADAT